MEKPPSVRLKLKFDSEALERTPAFSDASRIGLRPLRIMFLICASSTSAPTVAVSDWMREATAWTVTDSVMVPTSRVTSTVSGRLASSLLPLEEYRLKPCASTVTVYMPEGRLVTENAPLSEELVLRSTPVAS